MKTILESLLALVVIGLIAILAFGPESSATRPNRLITLSERNTVSLNLPIDGATATYVQSELMKASNSLSRKSTIYLVLNSPGGEIGAGKRIIDTALGLPQNVSTISIFSASMSFIISQYLDDRYVMETSTMMSHRAHAEGLSGDVPGNLVTRTLSLLNEMISVDEHVAKRASLTHQQYEDLIRDELWLEGQQAVTLKMADEVVRVRCDESLQGPGPTREIQVLFWKAKVVFHKCPLITTPLSASMDTGASVQAQQKLYEMLYDKAAYINDFGSIK